ncbi:MAG: peptidase [Patescibacteria group bacterium]|nr:peptidase [Patescibacteria group bacterium]
MHQPSRARPIIGLTSGEIHNIAEPWSPVAFGQSRTYVDSIIQAGGTPLILPLSADEAVLRPLYELLDGLCLAGGNDLDPALYGQEPYTGASDHSALRDTTEQMLLRWALQDRKPLLGICRGMQLLNVESGGTLHQEIAQDLPGTLDHNASTKLKSLEDLSHTLRLGPDSKLANILAAGPIGTNAHHHQAIDKLGAGVKATAWTSDDVIEAIELINYPYAIGIQAHPESLTSVEPRWAKLFESFVAATREQTLQPRGNLL